MIKQVVTGKKTALLLDIDNTLTPPRQPLTKQMASILERLNVPFHLVAGTHLELLREQFFEPLYTFGFRKQFDAYLSNGAIHYRCDYSKDMSIKVITSFNIHKYLGDANYNFLIEVLGKTLRLEEFKPPPFLKVIGETITFRESMINFTPIGRSAREDLEVQQNRKNFVEFDRSSGFRQRIMDYLKREMSALIAQKDLAITLGGQTSFDIGIIGQDKTKAVHTLLDAGVERIVFIGDALYEGGNDAAVRELREKWPSPPPCPLELIQVSSWRETVKHFYELGFINEQIE